jgi:hypothetical protein
MATTTSTAVGTGAAVILPAQPFSQPGTSSVVISNLNASVGSIFVGGPAVTVTTGVEVAKGTNLVLPAVSGVLYAIAAAGGNTAVVGIF